MIEYTVIQAISRYAKVDVVCANSFSTHQDESRQYTDTHFIATPLDLRPLGFDRNQREDASIRSIAETMSRTEKKQRFQHE